jgi:hypothetical protein
MKKIQFVVFLIGLSLKMVAQNEDWRDPAYSDFKRHGEYIVNVTPLIAQLVPFNGSTLSSKNWFDYQYRRLKNGKGFRFGLGVDVNGFDSNRGNQLQFVYLRFGYQRKIQFAKHFHFSRSFDFNALAEDRNRLAVNPQTKGADFSGIGLSYSMGLECSFNQHISISTESTLFLGVIAVDNAPAKFVFLPPVGLFFHVRL